MFSQSIDALSDASERNWSDAAELGLILQELHHRDSRAAVALRQRLRSRLDELSGNAAKKSDFLSYSASAQIDNDQLAEDEEADTSAIRDAASIQVDVAEKIGFVSQQNAVPPLRGISVTNNQDEPLEKAVLTLETDPGFLSPRSWQIDYIAAGETLHILDQRVDISASYTKGLSESERGTVSLKLRNQDGEPLAMHDAPTELLASDQWGGTDAMPELLAAFVMPNDPAVDKVLKAASDALRRAGRPSGIDGYESGDRTRVYEFASAIWAAVAGLKLSYALPPASFERSGQKVRTPRAIFDGRIATCLDTALLFAATLEQARLNPLIVLTEGHAFVGCWLQPQEFAQLVTDEVGIVRTRMDLNELLLFETTLVADHPPSRFSQAVDEGRRQVSELSGEDLFVALDIRRARMQKLLPLATMSETREGGPPSVLERGELSARSSGAERADSRHESRREDVDGESPKCRHRDGLQGSDRNIALLRSRTGRGRPQVQWGV